MTQATVRTQTKQEQLRELTARLNQYREEYYHQNSPSVSDEIYDRLFDELKRLEEETGICMSNSPTQTVGYPVVSKLAKTTHTIPLLSLDKTKSEETLLSFMGEQQVMLMLKLDGLTVKLTYENGELQEAATRGDAAPIILFSLIVMTLSGKTKFLPKFPMFVLKKKAYLSEQK